MRKSDELLFTSLEDLAKSSYSKIFDFLHTGIGILSTEGIFLYTNTAFAKLFNFNESIVGSHVSEVFLTAEQGVMEALRTRTMTICSSVTKDNAQGVSFRYPIEDADGKLLGVIVEAIPTKIGRGRLADLLNTVKNLEEKADYLERKMLQKPGMLHTFDSIVGESDPMLEMKKLGRRFAKSTEPILLFGESGTGKELIAQALHSASERALKPFVAVNCAALPQELMESELFGYEAGSFTGAKAGGMKGKFELADNGTIFLDEIGDLPLAMQAKLLRVLESGEIQKIGHTGRLHSDFRLIAATNKNLLKLVDEERFREDLYHRLNILELAIPPLRERASDIPLLIRHFMGAALGRKRAKEIHVSNEVYRMFGGYAWRGNIRELRNVLTFALYNIEDGEDILTIRHLPARFLREVNEEHPEIAKSAGKTHNLAQASADAERKALLSALVSAKNNKTVAARLLGISRNKLYKKIHDLGVPVSQ
ncbi:MAG: sigma 54-interacting transcriptional regulator [Desulfovibrio sp.]|jgi:transcriptional regulator with PAS, ATPase and Fis domain|nr:sigma 54-interacting transcriptional regulator [Desulfovibrio sp.]